MLEKREVVSGTFSHFMTINDFLEKTQAGAAEACLVPTLVLLKAFRALTFWGKT